MKLTEIGSLSRGKSMHRPRNDKNLYGGKYPFVQTSDIKNANHILQTYEQTYNENGLKQSKLWSKNTICITIAANIAESAILGFDACFPDSVLGLVVDDKIADYHYIEYMLQHYKKTIQNQANGTSQENINLGTFEKVYFEIPNLPTQKKIGQILSALDDKISLNDKINSLLEKMAKLLYERYFLQFDFPDKNGKPYKTSGGAMKHSPLLNHPIPTTFEVRTIGDLVRKNSKKAQKDSTKSLIDLSVMPENTFCLNSHNAGDTFNTNLFEMQEFDILFGAIRPYLKKAGFAPFDGLVTGTIHSMKAIDPEFFSFILLTLTHKSFFDYAVSISKGTKMPIIAYDDLANFKIPFNESIVRKFSNILNFKEIIAQNIKQSQTLKALRDYLLPLLINGQIKLA
ncbi:restriction endonuclease subunit S [Campylobacter troglodytis]|uniref:restriction endonuclease subunit S n=1 Tax=Campylobacter troglodytis TaxID=654363 RepID=UPI00163BD0B1|nr:restriction endonuclease subunit S [Campylobacter troglodytis]